MSGALLLRSRKLAPEARRAGPGLQPLHVHLVSLLAAHDDEVHVVLLGIDGCASERHLVCGPQLVSEEAGGVDHCVARLDAGFGRVAAGLNELQEGARSAQHIWACTASERACTTTPPSLPFFSVSVRPSGLSTVICARVGESSQEEVLTTSA